MTLPEKQTSQIILHAHAVNALLPTTANLAPAPASAPQLATFNEAVMRHTEIPVQVEAAMAALPPDAHPMGVILTGICALSTCHPEQNPALAGQNIYKSREVQDKQIVRLLGKVPTLAAFAYHKSTGRRPQHPNQRLSYAENFLFMLDGGYNPQYRPNPRLSRALVRLSTCASMLHDMAWCGHLIGVLGRVYAFAGACLLFDFAGSPAWPLTLQALLPRP